MNLAADTDLAALERIRQLKYRYLRCVDLKQWDELAGTLTPGATADYGTPALGKPVKLEGRDAIVGFLRDSLGPGIITTHFAGQPEITFDGTDTSSASTASTASTASSASGTWCFEDTVIATEYRVMIKGSAFYQDRYARGTDGEWRITHTGYVRTYELTLSLDDVPSLRISANRWAPQTA